MGFSKLYIKAHHLFISRAKSIQSTKLPTDLFKIQCMLYYIILYYIILPSKLRSSTSVISSRFPHQNPVCTSHSYKSQKPHSSHISWFDLQTLWWAVQTMKLFIAKLPLSHVNPPVLDPYILLCSLFLNAVSHCFYISGRQTGRQKTKVYKELSWT